MTGGVTSGSRTFLDGLRVVEIGNELGEYCGKLLAGLGADVVRVEPPGGDETRGYGPFQDDEPHPDRSLYFWHYNLGKRSVVLDLDTTEGQEQYRTLVRNADVVVDSRPSSYLEERGIDRGRLMEADPGLLYVRISPFGDDGPWAEWQGSDLVHLALGGVMMNCGYDPDPFGHYDLPPVAPQMWHAYAITGEMAVISLLGALHHRMKTGRGQYLSASVHHSVSQATETDMPDWVFLREPHFRHTGRSSRMTTEAAGNAITKDGRYIQPYNTYLRGTVDAWPATVELLKKYNSADEKLSSFDDETRFSLEATRHIRGLTEQLASRLLYKADLWLDAQRRGLTWAPIRRPEENVDDAHWHAREAMFEVDHPELGRSFTYTGAKWFCPEVPWTRGPRPPLVGEHTELVLKEWGDGPRERTVVHLGARAAAEPLVSKRSKPFALSDIRVVDLGWMLASAGAGRYLAAMGAEVIKVEHESRLDGMRNGVGMCPPGGREQRDRATETIVAEPTKDPNRSGAFMEYNAGKLGMSLNLKSPEGRAILEDLIRDADVLVEGYSPGTMERMGFGYERLKELNPRIIYVGQSGFGAAGTYGQMRAYGQTAQAFSGVTDMTGLPEPCPPAGIGYSYLDWWGAYNIVTATLAALHRRGISGAGCHIDSSQAEAGIYLTGTAVLDYTVNGRRWSRLGNRSPYKPAAPSGAYRAQGEDRWVAVSAFTEEQWVSLTDVLGLAELAADPRFATLEARLAHQDELDELVDRATSSWDRYALMETLQARGIPAGVCQDAPDRCEIDAQLEHLGWLVELEQSTIGRWPVKEHPVLMSETPAYIGGRFDRSGPTYGEDTDRVLTGILGMTAEQVSELRAQGTV